MSMKIGLLDFGEIDTNSNAIETIHHSIANAVLAEEKGFTRYWLTEHYLSGIAWRNPEPVMTLIAASTETIRVGAAGVLVPLHAPYRIAQDFKLLSNLFPDRIDLGFAKGNIDRKAAEEISNQHLLTDFFEKIKKTQLILMNKMEHVQVSPQSSIVPDLWMLGTGSSSVDFATEQKMNFSISLFHNLEGTLPSPHILSEFKEKFIHKNGYAPQVNIAVSVFCSEDSRRIAEERRTRKNVLLNIDGNPVECMQKMEALVNRYQVDEVIVLNLGKDHAEKQLLIETLLTA